MIRIIINTSNPTAIPPHNGRVTIHQLHETAPNNLAAINTSVNPVKKYFIIYYVLVINSNSPLK